MLTTLSIASVGTNQSGGIYPIAGSGTAVSVSAARGGDVLADIMFTMRSEPIGPHSPEPGEVA